MLCQNLGTVIVILAAGREQMCKQVLKVKGRVGESDLPTVLYERPSIDIANIGNDRMAFLDA
jgi:hypothetical protein